MRYDLTDLLLFVHVVEAGTVTAGAARTNLALAAASARIRLLEDRLGVRLLDRGQRGIKSTPAGDALFHHARTIVADAQKLDAELGEFSCGLKGRIRLMSNTNALAEFLPRALGSFLALNPDISVVVEERLSYEIAKSVTAGETDIGIVAATTDVMGLQSFPFARDRLLAVLPVSSALATTSITFESLLEYPFVGLQESSAIQSFLAEKAAILRRPLKLRMQLLSFHGVCRMVEAGAGVAVVPESAALRCGKGMAIRMLALADEWSLRDMRLCVRNTTPLPPLPRLLLRHLRDSEAFKETDKPPATS